VSFVNIAKGMAILYLSPSKALRVCLCFEAVYLESKERLCVTPRSTPSAMLFSAFLSHFTRVYKITFYLRGIWMRYF